MVVVEDGLASWLPCRCSFMVGLGWGGGAEYEFKVVGGLIWWFPRRRCGACDAGPIYRGADLRSSDGGCHLSGAQRASFAGIVGHHGEASGLPHGLRPS
jgi:hypothetical protein